MKSDPVGIVIINYNEGERLVEALASIKKLVTPVQEVVLVDDGSTDGSVEWAKQAYPGIRVIGPEKNMGNVSRLRNLGMGALRSNKIFITDSDIVLEPDCIEQLLEAHKRLPGAAILTPRLLYAEQKERIYADGQKLHYLCTTIAPSRNRSVGEAEGEITETAGCGIMLLDRTRLDGTCYFDEAIPWGWGDDGQIFRRAQLAGYGCYNVPQAVAFHYGKTRTTERAQFQVQNRWSLILETYQFRTILLIFPALVLYEFFLFALLVSKGALGAYFRGNAAVLKNLPRIWAKRKRIAQIRTVGDRETLTSGPLYVSPALVANPFLNAALRAASAVFNFYWFCVRRFI
ncbi:MAG: glycosyltransferase family 2 protein [Candidatus Omnitrophica bacterium]|nr:glycosyltransferase family 2 protein [Candidatus Omnitrophota bacterium]